MAAGLRPVRAAADAGEAGAPPTGVVAPPGMVAEMDDIPVPVPEKPQRFVAQFRQSVRRAKLSYATERTYLHWVLRFIRFHRYRHPREMGEREVERFLNDLAERLNCSVATQRTALNALVFLYRRHLGIELGKLNFGNARRPRRMPTVFTHDEAMAVIGRLEGANRLIASLLYGSGLRIREALSLRIKDIDFGSAQVTVKNGKGGADRCTLLPRRLEEPLREQVKRVTALHAWDTSRGYGEVWLPDALARKYPAAATELAWQFLFPSANVGPDPRTGVVRRHHRHYSVFQKAMKKAVRAAGIHRRAGAHTFRHSFATRLVETGYDIRLVQSLLGHADIRTTEVYLHVVRNRAHAIASPVDAVATRANEGKP